MTRIVIDASALLSGIVATDPSPPARLIDGVSVQLRDPRDPPRVLRDRDDDYLVALALTAGARAIVTGDRHGRS